MAPRKLLAISHPAVRAVNQTVYAGLQELGWDLTLVVPDTWRDDYSDGKFAAEALPELNGRLVRLPVALAGRPQRHLYLARCKSLIRSLAPDAAFLEQEPFSVSAWQWSRALVALDVPFGLQSDENLDRRFPLPARLIRARVLPRPAFIAARSPAAASLVRAWGAGCPTPVIPHPVPVWQAAAGSDDRHFTVGFAGRLVPEKGVLDLVAAARRLPGPLRVLMVGNGPLRAELERTELPNGEVRVLTDVAHEDMASAYAQMDVLVLPSRTTPTWAEQFGRVLVESMLCGVPVVGSDSGEIPWVIETTGGGSVFPEGDVDALASVLRELQDDPVRRRELASHGAEASRELFTVPAVARQMDAALDDAATSSTNRR